jgi:hypothetical protein
MRTRAVLPVVIALAVAVAGLHLAAGTAASTHDGDHVHLEVQLRESGAAVWTVTARYSLNSSSEVAAFDDLGDEFEANETADGPQIQTFRELARRAAAETGRSMAVTVEAREAEVQNRSQAAGEGSATGILRLRFEWTNFARTVNGSLEIGDAFGSAWELGPAQELVIRPPADYSVDSVTPSTSVQNGVIRWSGPQEFGADQPAVRYVPGGGTPPEEGDNGLLMYAGALAVVVGIGGLILYAWHRREGPADGGVDTGGQEEGATGPADADEPATGDRGEPAEETEETGEGGAVEPDLLSDEEQVEQLLEANGGRMKQAAIVEETGWSNAKVSQLLSAMDEEGRVEKLRIGRENLIRLPDDEGTT